MAKLGGKIKENLSKRKWKIKVKTWMLVVILIPLFFVDATLLRNNHIRMTELRDKVMSADAEEDDAKLAEALTKLKEFVFHDIVINIVEENGTQRVTFGTGPFYLEHLYERDATKALEEARAQLMSDSNPYGNVYGQAAAICDALAEENGWNWASPGYMNCMTSEIAKYPAAGEIQDTMVAKLPSTELYRRNYASPVWAPTLTGIMLIVTLMVIVVIFIRFVVWIVLRLSLLFI
ncbi:hypothetical protein IKG68_02510 [Candidatus Saccharibacteria bacterium]|nr:hypothetical protein [Candidatus Saccharibacteria bacterium]